MRVGVVTIAHGRHDHLAAQRAGLARSTVPPDVHVVVAMDDERLPDGVASAVERRVVHVPLQDGHLPLARARNVGAAEAVVAGADVLVFLDVDCIPAVDLVDGYVAAATDDTTADDVLCGPVTYLSPPGREGYPLDALDDLDDPHAARPAPPRGVVERSLDQYELFWSLSFALTRHTWEAVGGFDERYVGYGGEDTDFARRAERAGRALAWVGSARAYHQHHPVSVPPVEHVDDIVRNARLFHATWGTWPMQGWLDEFERRGLVHRLPDGTYVAAAEEVAAGGGGGTLDSWLGSSRAAPHLAKDP